jgi:hypothetical protein
MLERADRAFPVGEMRQATAAGSQHNFFPTGGTKKRFTVSQLHKPLPVPPFHPSKRNRPAIG